MTRRFDQVLVYGNKVYERLADHFGGQKVFILSAGWGLIRADFLTPYYDITFSQSADAYKRRKKTDRYADFCMPPGDTDDDIFFFGGKDYLPLFCLTDRCEQEQEACLLQFRARSTVERLRPATFGNNHAHELAL
jgi:hypothetical protein